MKIRNVVMIPIICMIVGYILLVLVDLIPTRWIQNEAKESADILINQGKYPSGFVDGWFLDNWTDADCISIVFNKSTNNPFYNAINAYQISDENATYVGSIEGLFSSVNGEGVNVGDHSYLWNGFQIWLRILMIKYNISDIRIFLFVLIIFLSSLVCVLLAKVKENVFAFIPFLISFSFFNFQMESMSLLFFNDYCIGLIGCIAVIGLTMNNNTKYIEETFSLLGATVAFTSMLIVPAFTLGFPLVVYLSTQKGKTFRETFKKMLGCVISWTIAYGLTMITKIMLSTLIINSDMGALRVYTYLGQESYTLLSRYSRISEVFLRILNESEVKIHIVSFLIIALVVYALLTKFRNFERVTYAWNLLFVALIPCVWCFVCAGHAGHGWTQWNYSIAIYAVIQLLWEMCDIDVPKGKKTNTKY